MLFQNTLLDDPAFRLSVAAPILDRAATEPDLCLTDSGGWVIWTQQHPDGDHICLRSFSDAGFGDVMNWSASVGIEYHPAIITLRDGRILGVHAARRNGEYLLLARYLHNDVLSSESIIFRSSEGLFRPRLLAVNTTIWLIFEAVEGRQTMLMYACCSDGRWGEPSAFPEAPSSWCNRAALAATPDDAIWCAYDSYRDGAYDIYLQRLDTRQPPIRITQGGYQNVQPALTADGDGRLWIAYATNDNRARRDPWWLTKWNVVRCYDGQTVYDVPAQPESDVYSEDSFQGWEFPALAQTPAGGVWVFGQSAHTLYMAGCSAAGWSPLYTIADKHWGSWKPRIRVAGKNPIYVVSMSLQGAQIQCLEIRSDETAPPLLQLHLPPAASPVSVKAAERAALKTPNGEDLQYFFGDLHCHSIYGDATNDADEIYHRYRDAYHYDFACLTEHDFLDHIELSHAELNMLWDVATRVSEPGRFIAMYGYEWTSPAIAEHAELGGKIGEGHRHVIYPDDAGPLISYGRPESNTGAKLLARLQGRRALVIPHHTSWSGTDWDAHDPEIQRVVEICSTHGRFEYPGNLPIGYRRDHIHPEKFVQDALDRGYKLGFVGGSDSHGLRWHATEPDGRDSFVPAGTRVGWTEDAYRSGMAVVLAPELTREAVYDALYQRRCYATSGVPIVLDFRVNDQLMGSEITIRTAPKLSISVTGTAALHAVEIIRSGYVFGGLHVMPGEAIQTLQFELDDRIIIPGEDHYYYLRVLQADGNMAWSSPIWVTYTRS